MPQQLAYVIITPYSLHKSRTGGILSRLITRTGLALVDLRMFAQSGAFVKEDAQPIVSEQDMQERKIQEVRKEYVLENLAFLHIIRRNDGFGVFLDQSGARRKHSQINQIEAGAGDEAAQNAT